MSTGTDGDLITSAEAASILRVSRSTLSQWVRKGYVPESAFVRSLAPRGQRRYRRAEVERLAQQRGIAVGS